MPTDRADASLLSQYADTGDAAAFSNLVDRHAPLVFSVCRSVLGRHHDAEDAAQATFLTLARRAGDLRSHPSIAGWIHRVAWYVATRARAARTLRDARERAAAAPRPTEAPAPTAQSEQVAILHAALADLPEKYRIPLILHHLEGWSEPETAEVLGCRLGTVSGRLSRGRAMLRQKLRDRGADGLGVGALTRVDLPGVLVPQGFAGSITGLTQTAANGIAAHVQGLALAADRTLRSEGRRRILWMLAGGAFAAAAVTVAILAITTFQWSGASPPGAPVAGTPAREAAIVEPAGPFQGPLPADLARGWVIGTVRGPSGGPVQDGRVLVYRTMADADAGANRLAITALQPDGSFRVESLPESNLYVTVIVIYAAPPARPQDFSTRITGSNEGVLVHAIVAPTPRRR